jgi:SAM-dependent methyltransferase
MIRKFVDQCVRIFFRTFTLGMKKRWSFARSAMYLQIQKYSAGLERGGLVLNISHSEDLMDVIGLGQTQVTQANYPEVSIFELPFPDNSFDWAVSDQCFEHLVGNPQDAMDEVMRVLKPGGQMLHTTCFMTAYHGAEGSLEDFWRFSPRGLLYLCKGAAKAHADGSGHPLTNLMTSFGLGFEPVPVAQWHPFSRLLQLRSPGHANMVWVWAQKS